MRLAEGKGQFYPLFFDAKGQTPYFQRLTRVNTHTSLGFFARKPLNEADGEGFINSLAIGAQRF
jgi:hypothetical protein